MALDTTSLRNRVKSKLDAYFGVMAEPGNTYRLNVATAIAEAVVEEIQANGKAQIGTSLSGLQRVGGVDTQAPSATKEIPLV